MLSCRHVVSRRIIDCLMFSLCQRILFWLCLRFNSWFSCRLFFFFFQAEDGIRDLTVTGVQTCALPIYLVKTPHSSHTNCVLQILAQVPLPAPLLSDIP